jgi:hypothetical protein
VSNLVQDASFGKGKRTVQYPFREDADLFRIRAVEPANLLHAVPDEADILAIVT